MLQYDFRTPTMLGVSDRIAGYANGQFKFHTELDAAPHLANQLVHQAVAQRQHAILAKQVQAVQPLTDDVLNGTSRSRFASEGIHSASEKTKIKRQRNKTLAKPMLYNRLLNCRASGLLEQTDAVNPSIHPRICGYPNRVALCHQKECPRKSRTTRKGDS